MIPGDQLFSKQVQVLVKCVILCVCVLPVFGVCDGVDDGVVDGRGFGDDSGHRVHVGRQHVGVPAAANNQRSEEGQHH